MTATATLLTGNLTTVNTPIDNYCECDFDWPEPDGEKSWHYRRTCPICDQTWGAMHCEHDGVQNGCPRCGWRDPGKRTPPQILGLR